MPRRSPLVLLLILAACATRIPPPEDLGTLRLALPDQTPVVLEPLAQFACPEINESSGVIKSRTWDGIYWTLNDSGDTARIFAVQRDGTLLQPDWLEGCPGIQIADAVNIDWEDLAADDQGNLIIGACGNNFSVRRDLALYLVPEPHPLGCSKVRTAARYRFRFPDQTEFPPPQEESNFDCEAVTYYQGRIYLITKQRGDRVAGLYRFDSLDPVGENVPEKIGRIALEDLVTAADIDPESGRLAVLTTGAVWLFTPPEGSDRYFQGELRWLPIQAGQCEAICFDGEELLITNEEGSLFSVSLDRLQPVPEGGPDHAG